jgi:hypothetical protein
MNKNKTMRLFLLCLVLTLSSALVEQYGYESGGSNYVDTNAQIQYSSSSTPMDPVVEYQSTTPVDPIVDHTQSYSANENPIDPVVEHIPTDPVVEYPIDPVVDHIPTDPVVEYPIDPVVDHIPMDPVVEYPIDPVVDHIPMDPVVEYPIDPVVDHIPMDPVVEHTQDYPMDPIVEDIPEHTSENPTAQPEENVDVHPYDESDDENSSDMKPPPSPIVHLEYDLHHYAMDMLTTPSSPPLEYDHHYAVDMLTPSEPNAQPPPPYDYQNIHHHVMDLLNPPTPPLAPVEVTPSPPPPGSIPVRVFTHVQSFSKDPNIFPEDQTITVTVKDANGFMSFYVDGELITSGTYQDSVFYTYEHTDNVNDIHTLVKSHFDAIASPVPAPGMYEDEKTNRVFSVNVAREESIETESGMSLPVDTQSNSISQFVTMRAYDSQGDVHEIVHLTSTTLQALPNQTDSIYTLYGMMKTTTSMEYTMDEIPSVMSANRIEISEQGRMRVVPETRRKLLEGWFLNHPNGLVFKDNKIKMGVGYDTTLFGIPLLFDISASISGENQFSLGFDFMYHNTLLFATVFESQLDKNMPAVKLLDQAIMNIPPVTLFTIGIISLDFKPSLKLIAHAQIVADISSLYFEISAGLLASASLRVSTPCFVALKVSLGITVIGDIFQHGIGVGVFSSEPNSFAPLFSVPVCGQLRHIRHIQTLVVKPTCEICTSLFCTHCVPCLKGLFDKLTVIQVLAYPEYHILAEICTSDFQFSKTPSSSPPLARSPPYTNPNNLPYLDETQLCTNPQFYNQLCTATCTEQSACLSYANMEYKYRFCSHHATRENPDCQPCYEMCSERKDETISGQSIASPPVPQNANTVPPSVPQAPGVVEAVQVFFPPPSIETSLLPPQTHTQVIYVPSSPPMPIVYADDIQLNLPPSSIETSLLPPQTPTQVNYVPSSPPMPMLNADDIHLNIPPPSFEETVPPIVENVVTQPSPPPPTNPNPNPPYAPPIDEGYQPVIEVVAELVLLPPTPIQVENPPLPVQLPPPEKVYEEQFVTVFIPGMSVHVNRRLLNDNVNALFDTITTCVTNVTNATHDVIHISEVESSITDIKVFPNGTYITLKVNEQTKTFVETIEHIVTTTTFTSCMCTSYACHTESTKIPLIQKSKLQLYTIIAPTVACCLLALCIACWAKWRSKPEDILFENTPVVYECDVKETKNPVFVDIETFEIPDVVKPSSFQPPSIVLDVVQSTSPDVFSTPETLYVENIQTFDNPIAEEILQDTNAMLMYVNPLLEEKNIVIKQLESESILDHMASMKRVQRISINQSDSIIAKLRAKRRWNVVKSALREGSLFILE